MDLVALRAAGAAWLTVIAALLLLPAPASAYSPLQLSPASTVIAVLDRVVRLASRENKALLEAAGFKVELIDACGADDEHKCVAGRLRDIDQRPGSPDVLLMTSAQHSGTVRALYAKPGVRDFLSGIVMFQARSHALDGLAPTGEVRPPLLAIARSGDEAELVQSTRRFADRIRNKGVWSWFFLLPEQMSRVFRPGDHDVVIKLIYQKRIADMFGVTPNYVGAEEADQLVRLLAGLR